MPSDGSSQQDQKSSQAPPTLYPADVDSRGPTLHKQPPALPPKPFSRLPNHLTGGLVSVHAPRARSFLGLSLCLILSLPLSHADGTPMKLPSMSVKLSPPLPPKKLMISVPAGSMEPSPLAFQKCPAPSSHTPGLPYGTLPIPLHPPSRIIEELNKTLALTMQRFER